MCDVDLRLSRRDHRASVTHSEIKLIDAKSGKPFPCAPAGFVLASSAPLRWRGIVVERHRLPPMELPEHSVMGHGLAVSAGDNAIRFGWRDGKRRRDQVLNPGEYVLITHGDLNAPRWLEPFDEVSLVLDPRFVAGVVQDGLHADRIELETQHCARDPIIARYASAFLSELAGDSPNGPLYADALAVGFALHLLSNHAVERPKMPAPAGKLNSFQLRNVVEFIQSHLDEHVSLLDLAARANVSAFHFARQFRATVGLPPHQFVLQQRIQRSLGLVAARKLPLAQIAVDCGFHDQPHFTRAFRKIVGTTPARYARDR